MSPPRRTIDADTLERRRLLAAKDILAGVPPSEIGKRYGVTRTTVYRWLRAVRDKGPGAVLKRKKTGRPGMLSGAQLEMFASIYREGPRAAGLWADQWSGTLIVGMLSSVFGVTCTPDHAIRLATRLGLRKKVR